MGQQRIQIEPLISHRFEIDDAERAYQLIAGDAREPHLGVLLRYDPEREVARGVGVFEARKRGETVFDGEPGRDWRR